MRKKVDKAMKIIAEPTLWSPFVSLYSHSIVPGGFDVTS
jgi:hypothetical protein